MRIKLYLPSLFLYYLMKIK